MKTILISDSSRNMLAAHAEGNLLACTPDPSGGWHASFDDDVLEELLRFDADVNKAIEIVCTKQWGNA